MRVEKQVTLILTGDEARLLGKIAGGLSENAVSEILTTNEFDDGMAFIHKLMNELKK